MRPNILYPSHVEIAHTRWRIAQDLGLALYPEQDQDAGALIELGPFPEVNLKRKEPLRIVRSAGASWFFDFTC